MRSPKHLISVSFQIFAQWPIGPFTRHKGKDPSCIRNDLFCSTKMQMLPFTRDYRLITYDILVFFIIRHKVFEGTVFLVQDNLFND